jgi:hypothetical protein
VRGSRFSIRLIRNTLLGRCWDKQFLQDLDIDMRIGLDEHESAWIRPRIPGRAYNMTIYRFAGMEYLLDVNPGV